MSLHKELSEKIPDRAGLKTFAIAAVAAVLVSIVGVQIASLWFASPASRTCYAMGAILEDFAGILERAPDRKINCDSVYGLLLKSPPKLVEKVPWYASLFSTTMSVSTDLEEVATKIMRDNCADGEMRQGDLAAAIRRELERRCR